MLTAHALSPESIKESIKLGAVFFLPKEKMGHLKEFLEEVITGGNKPIWKKVFTRLEGYFAKRFGPDWKEKDEYLKKLEKELMNDTGN